MIKRARKANLKLNVCIKTQYRLCSSVIEEYMTEKVQFVVTSEGWHDSFEDALMENSNLNFVKPTWIYAINERQKMLPYQPHSVVP